MDSYRLVVDYRRLNKVTEPNTFPTDNAMQILIRLQNSKICQARLPKWLPPSHDGGGFRD